MRSIKGTRSREKKPCITSNAMHFSVCYTSYSKWFLSTIRRQYLYLKYLYNILRSVPTIRIVFLYVEFIVLKLRPNCYYTVSVTTVQFSYFDKTRTFKTFCEILPINSFCLLIMQCVLAVLHVFAFIQFEDDVLYVGYAAEYPRTHYYRH